MTRHRSSAALALLVAGLFMALVGWPATAVGSTTPGVTAPTPTPTARPTAAPQPTVDVKIMAITPQVLDVTSEEHITVVVRITNLSTTTITSGQARLSLAARNMRSRDEVTGWADGSLDLTPQLLAWTDLPESFAPNTSVDVSLTVDRTARQMLDDGKLVNEWGPRGLVVEVDDGTTRPVEARTFLLVKSNQDIPQAPVALLAALTGPPVAPTLPKVGDSTTRTLDAASRERIEQVSQAVASSPKVGVAVDPALETEASAEALAQVANSGREVLRLPWGDPDLQALAQAQTWDLLNRARQLAATDETDQSIVWSVSPVDDETVAAVRATNAALMIAPASTASTVTPTSAQDDDLTVLHPDETVSGLFDGSSGLTSAQAQQQALALLATAARGTDDSEPEPVLVVTSRDWQPDAAWTHSFAAALDGAPWVRLTTTTDLKAGDHDRDLNRATTDEPTPMPDAGLAELDADRRDLAKFATVTERPGVVTAGVDQATLLAASYAWRTDPVGHPAAVTGLRQGIAQRRNALYLTQRVDLTLITKKGDVRFNVRNDLPVAATVRVRLEPTKPCLRGDSRSTSSDSAQVSSIWSPVVTAEPISDTPVTVTLHAQANCQVTVKAELIGTDGAVVTTDPVEFSTTVRAQLEVVGTTVVGVLLGLGLVLGVVRTVRRGQSARRGDRTTTDPVRLGVLGGETPIAGIPVVKLLTPIAGIPAVKKPVDPPDETT